MAQSPKVVGVELLVSDIVSALDYLTVIFGAELVFRGVSSEPPGERAVLDAGTITITLFEPSTTGPGLLADRRPRVTQLIWGADAGSAATVAEQSSESGVPMRRLPDDRRYVSPEVMEGIFGFDIALTLSVVDDLG